MKSLKKIFLIGLSLFLTFSFLSGEKNNNSNKYIFAAGQYLVIFDGETKEVKRKKFAGNVGENIFYFPKVKRIAIGLSSININNLNDSFSADLSKLKKTDKPYYFVDPSYSIGKYKGGKNKLIFKFIEWNYKRHTTKYWDNAVPDNDKKHRRIYSWDILKNTFEEVFNWDFEAGSVGMYPVYDSFYKSKFGEVTEEIVKKTDEARKNKFRGIKNLSREDKIALNRKIFKRGLKFKKLLKSEKIDIGPYTDSSIDEMSFMVTGGRYIAVLNDKLYLVHMRSKKVYTLIPEKQDINYFIIEKNEDDLELGEE